MVKNIGHFLTKIECEQLGIFFTLWYEKSWTVHAELDVDELVISEQHRHAWSQNPVTCSQAHAGHLSHLQGHQVELRMLCVVNMYSMPNTNLYQTHYSMKEQNLNISNFGCQRAGNFLTFLQVYGYF